MYINTHSGRKPFLKSMLHHIDENITHAPSRQRCQHFREIFLAELLWAIVTEKTIYVNKKWRGIIEEKLEQNKVFVKLAEITFQLPEESCLAAFF